jgi:hypothetical protein
MGESKTQMMHAILEYKSNKLTLKRCSTPGYKQNISYSSEKVFIHHDAKPDEVFTLATVDDLITYDPKQERALKMQRYSCVFSHITERIPNSNYIVTPTPGFRVLFMGEMKFDPRKQEYHFKL